MIILDTETTGMLKPDVVAEEHQPEVIEFAAVCLDDHTLAECARLEFFCKPRRLPLAPEIIKITGITSEMLADAVSFARWVPKLQEFFLGQRVMVAHNCYYDATVLAYELRRINHQYRFPWPSQHIDTVELTMDLPAPRQKSARLKLSELYQFCFGVAPKVSHRAMDDVETLTEIVRWLRKKDNRI